MSIKSLRGEDERDDKPIECKGFSENQNKNHPYKDLVLLCVCSHSSVSYDTDCQASSLRIIIFTKELKPQHSPEAKWA